MNSLSIKTKFGWIGALEQRNKIVKVKFGKYKNRSVSKNLKRFRNNLINFLNRKNNILESNFALYSSGILS